MKHSGSRALSLLERWEALGEETQTALIHMAADLKKSGVVREKIRMGIAGRRYRQVFKGSEAIDWLVQSEAVGSRMEAVQHCELLIAGNVLRSAIDDTVDFKDSNRAIYRFVADDNPCDGPSVASIVSCAMLEGWLNVVFTGHVPVYLRRSRKERYCIVKQHGRSSILYYYTSDTAAKPEGFINLDRRKTVVTIRHFDHHGGKDAFRLTATAGKAKLDMIGVTANNLQVERWIRTFVIAGATYTERFRRGVASATSIYDFTAYDIYQKPVAFDRFRGRVVLVVNVASKSKLAALQFTQLQRLHEDYWDGGNGLVIVAFPCDQFEHEEPTDGLSIVDAVSQYGVQFYIMEKANVNGCGTSLHVPPVWEFLKSKKEGDNGPYIPWNFTKFLIDRRGNPVQRYEPSIQPNNLRDDIDALLAAPCPAASTVSQLMRPIQHDYQRNQHSRRASDEITSALLPPTSATTSTTAPRAPPSVAATRIHASADTRAMQAMPDLGPYYTQAGAGPFPPSPVMQPSRARVGAARVSPLKLSQLTRTHRFVRDRPPLANAHVADGQSAGAGPPWARAVGAPSQYPGNLPAWHFHEAPSPGWCNGVAWQISSLTAAPAAASGASHPRAAPPPALVLQPPPSGHRRRDETNAATKLTATEPTGLQQQRAPPARDDMHYAGFDDVFVTSAPGRMENVSGRADGTVTGVLPTTALSARESGPDPAVPAARVVSQAGGDGRLRDTITSFGSGDGVHLPPCGTSLPALLDIVATHRTRRGFHGDALAVLLDDDYRWFEDYDGVFHRKDDGDSGTGGSNTDGGVSSDTPPSPTHAEVQDGCHVTIDGRPMSISAACTPTLEAGGSDAERKDSACLSMSTVSPTAPTARFTFNLPTGTNAPSPAIAIADVGVAKGTQEPIQRSPPRIFSPIRGPTIGADQEPLAPVVSNLRMIGLLRKWALQNPDIRTTTV
eukprot:m.225874 g.225874  ORF g.225874 m.225874 type:complete len:951 (-) comp19218_c0_seq1:159-3011(-)